MKCPFEISKRGKLRDAPNPWFTAKGDLSGSSIIGGYYRTNPIISSAIELHCSYPISFVANR
jgi:hypothetical protein